jgi:hypothetical protein
VYMDVGVDVDVRGSHRRRARVRGDVYNRLINRGETYLRGVCRDGQVEEARGRGVAVLCLRLDCCWLVSWLKHEGVITNQS